MDRCFVVTPPGFESQVEQEIREVWPDLLDSSARAHSLPVPEFERLHGGLEFETDLFAAVQLNFFLKTASRILLRMDEFRVRDFPKLHERLRKIDLRSWIGDADAKVEAAAQGSRLGHETRIEETARKAWGLKDSADAPHRISLRISDDQCVVSLDTSGEHLHRRGILVKRGQAPMRETLAAFCLHKMLTGVSPAESREVTLIDPMCGSGTLLLEAASLWRPSLQRTYAFQSFRRLPKLFQQKNFERNYRLDAGLPFGRFIGRDLDEKVLQAARENSAALLEGEPEMKKAGLAFDFAVEDLMSTKKSERGKPLPTERRWVICNPPYGERLNSPPPQELVNRMIEVWSPERLGVLLPEGQARSLKWSAQSARVVEVPIQNGGIDCRFVVRDFSLKS
jgi:putative N6-adenine-specific DNA methylase